MKNMRVFLPSGRIWNLPGATAVGPGWSYVFSWLRGIRRYVLHNVRHGLWKSTRIRDRSGREMLHQQGYHPSVLLRARFGRGLMARSSTALIHVIRKRKWMIFLTIVPCIQRIQNFFSQTLFDFKKSISGAIELKFSGKTLYAIL